MAVAPTSTRRTPSPSPQAAPTTAPTAKAKPVAKAPAPTPAARPTGAPGYSGVSTFKPAGPRPGSFDAQVRGKAPKAVDADLMRLSRAAYDPSVKQVGPYTRMTDAELKKDGIDPGLLQNSTDGFKAAVFKGPGGQKVVAFAGTDTKSKGDLFKDAVTDVGQGLGVPFSGQYRQAVALAKQANRAYGDNVVMTGHSLGGGLAATAALATGRPAVTFNAAGVHRDTLLSVGVNPWQARTDAASGLVRAYSVRGEVLTTLQQSRPEIPDALGSPVYLNDPHPPTLSPTWNPFEMRRRVEEYGKELLARPFQLHGSDSVIQALETQRPWLQAAA